MKEEEIKDVQSKIAAKEAKLNALKASESKVDLEKQLTSLYATVASLHAKEASLEEQKTIMMRSNGTCKYIVTTTIYILFSYPYPINLITVDSGNATGGTIQITYLQCVSIIYYLYYYY